MNDNRNLQHDMHIAKVHIENFRSIRSETLEMSNISALVGRNGCGKSAFLRALELFYDLQQKIDIEDFYNRDAQQEIVVSVTYTDLNETAKKIFAKYLEGEEFTVEKVLTVKDGKSSSSYHGAELQHIKFSDARHKINNKQVADAKKDYSTLKTQEEYSSLGTATTKETMEAEFTKWENMNPDKCVRTRDGGNFLGFKGVGIGSLSRFTKFIFVPAVRDAGGDASDNSNSPLAEIIELVVRSALRRDPQWNDFKTEMQERFTSILEPLAQKDLKDLANGMSDSLKVYAPETGIEMIWLKTDVTPQLPKVDTRLVQDGYSSPVSKAGHGLQRAFVITALQYLTTVQQRSVPDELGELPVLVLGIEEPELFQHPNSQRHLSRILFQLSQQPTPGVADKIQVLYCTHSPHFVSIDHIESIKILRKKRPENKLPKATYVTSASSSDIAKKHWEVYGGTGPEFTADTFCARLKSIMTPLLNEGFFADVAVLVEGSGDVAAIQAAAQLEGHDLAGLGISVIPCLGKGNIDRPALIFRSFGIPIYFIWDSDSNKKETRDAHVEIEKNARLQRLAGIEELVDFPQTQTRETWSCFKDDLESTLKAEIGDEAFSAELETIKTKYAITESDIALKNFTVLHEILMNLKKRGLTSQTLSNIVKNIVAIKT